LEIVSAVAGYLPASYRNGASIPVDDGRVAV
jgi:hypothetical protein